MSFINDAITEGQTALIKELQDAFKAANARIAELEIDEMRLIAANNRADELSAELQKANAKVAALEEAVRIADSIMVTHAGLDHYPAFGVEQWQARPEVAQALKGGGE